MQAALLKRARAMVYVYGLSYEVALFSALES
jgi:hypothetical protein